MSGIARSALSTTIRIWPACRRSMSPITKSDGGDPLDLLVGGIACQRHVDDLPGEGRPAEVVRRVQQQQLAVAEQPDDVALAGLTDVLRGDHH